MKTISAQVVVKNEARFIWYSIMSVIDVVKKIHILDTGSTDGTLEILQALEQLYRDKIFLEVKNETHFDEQLVRQKMLEKVDSDWFLVLDADEIWWNESISKVVQKIQSADESIESIVVPTINVVGDMFHYQEEAAGLYRLAGKTGHLAIRAVNRKIPGLHSLGEHGVWGWVDEENRMIQDRNPKSILFINSPYLHTTHLQRSGEAAQDVLVYKRRQKRKHEIGLGFPKDYFYPESFFYERPLFVPSVWEPMSRQFFMRSAIETPLRKIKRRTLPKKVGY